MNNDKKYLAGFLAQQLNEQQQWQVKGGEDIDIIIGDVSSM